MQLLGMSNPCHQPWKSSRTNSATKGGKKWKKPQTDERLDTESENGSTVPDTTESLQTELTKLIKEQWELKEVLKENQVVIEQLKRDLNKEWFEIARQRGLTTLAQQSARGAILWNLEFQKKLLDINKASKPPESPATTKLLSPAWPGAMLDGAQAWRRGS